MKQAKGRSAVATRAARGIRRAGELSGAGGAGRPSDRPARRDARDRPLLDRILDAPHLAHVVPRLQPELLHRVIQACGLEDCGELVSLATPEQLRRVLDLDLWRAARAGRDEQFDAERFGLWLEVLVDSGAAVAASKLAGIDAHLVIAGLAQHALVYDRAALTPYTTTDGDEFAPVRGLDDVLTCNVGGYVLVARGREASAHWDAIVTVLLALEAEHREFFNRVMSGCRSLSNPPPEIDGLHDLLGEADQALFDLALDRERRRGKQGYTTPAQARAFLQMSRELRRGPDTGPPTNPVARAYFRAIDGPALEESREASGAPAHPDSPGVPGERARSSSAVVGVLEILRDAGILDQQPRALLAGSLEQPTRLGRIQSQMRFLLERDPAVYSMRSQELAYLANTIMAGCSILARPFTAQEASDAAVAACNLGLENWPRHWTAPTAAGTPAPAQTGTALPEDFLVGQDLVGVFQVGWAVLHAEVGMRTAEQLIEVLVRLRCDDREIQSGLDALRIELTRHWREGAPWRSRGALDVVASLDMLAWATLLALIDELPVIHAGLDASRASRTLAVRASDFEFISENSQIARIREFLRSLPEMLVR